MELFKKINLFKRMSKAEKDINDLDSRLRVADIIYYFEDADFYETFPTYEDFYNSREWKKTRAKVLLRDEFKCRLCGKVGTTAHHINSAYYNPRFAFDLDNLITVCYDCHIKLTKEGNKTWKQ